jgi:hypothetical protein
VKSLKRGKIGCLAGFFLPGEMLVARKDGIGSTINTAEGCREKAVSSGSGK